MTPIYRHRQLGKVTLVASILALLGGIPILFAAMRSEHRGASIMAMVVLVIVLGTILLFAALEVTVDSQTLSWRFLPGLISKSVPMADVVEAKPTRTHFYEGWGIHYTNRGWLYNVSGFGAVEVKMRDGKQFMLGTDEPAQLADAINRTRATLPLA